MPRRAFPFFFRTTCSRCLHPIGRISSQRVSQGFLYFPRGSLFASPIDGTVSSNFPLPPLLQRCWQTHFPQLNLRLPQTFFTHNMSPVRHRAAVTRVRIVYYVLPKTINNIIRPQGWGRTPHRLKSLCKVSMQLTSF